MGGPLDHDAEQAGVGRAQDTHLQREITRQREQVWRDTLHADMLALPRTRGAGQASMAHHGGSLMERGVRVHPPVHAASAGGGRGTRVRTPPPTPRAVHWTHAGHTGEGAGACGDAGCCHACGPGPGHSVGGLLRLPALRAGGRGARRARLVNRPRDAAGRGAGWLVRCGGARRAVARWRFRLASV